MIDSGLDEVSLTVPAQAAYTRIVRLAAASLAVNQGMSFGEIDDLRTVIDTAIGVLVDVVGGKVDDVLKITFSLTSGKFVLEADRTGEGQLRPELVDAFVDDCAALIDGFEFSRDDCRMRISKTPAGDL